MGVTIIDNTQTINNATWRVQADVITDESGIVKENGTIHYIDGKLKYHANGVIKEVGVGTDYAIPVSGVITSLPGAFAFENINYLYAAGGVVFFNGDSWEYALTNADAAIGTLVNDVSTNKTYKWSGSSWVQYATQKVLDLSLSRKTDSYTLVAADNGQVVEMNKATANTLTVPQNIFTAGQQVLVTQYGAGQTTIAAGSGVTLRSDGGKLKINTQYSSATILFISATEAYVFGNLAL
jgi:hypothetical protein